jgi:acetyltransferase-like isoleucine patch superfamily enzyme
VTESSSGPARELLKRSPLGPLLRDLKARSADPREGAEMLFTQWLGRLPSRRLRTFVARRALHLRADPDSVLYQWRDLREPSGIEIGPGTVIGHWASLDGRRGLRIGRNVNCSSEVAMWTLQHDPDDPHFGVRGDPIVVEDYAWISFRATILPGVTVGRGAVVAANSVVTKDVEEFTIVGGIPARPIGTRSRDLEYTLTGGAPWFV